MIWKRLLLVVVLLGLIGGSYQVLWPPEGRRSWNHLAQETESQRRLAEGRRQALTDPLARESLFRQTLEERRAIAADREYAPALFDLEMSLLEQAAGTPPHDRRLAQLLIRALELAAEDADLRPALEQALNKTLKNPG